MLTKDYQKSFGNFSISKSSLLNSTLFSYNINNITFYGGS